MEQGVNEKAPKDSATLPQPPGNHRALGSTGVAQGWATSSVPNARPGLLMPFGTIAMGLKNATLKHSNHGNPTHPSCGLSGTLTMS